ncbi:hypothetical protein [Lacinutrix sp. MedPE-SW]|nr:hypothetical protein [Lacinutrix sp. MedPE-SW]
MKDQFSFEKRIVLSNNMSLVEVKIVIIPFSLYKISPLGHNSIK